MDQNPISILVVVASMVFLVLGLMQYNTTNMKAWDKKRGELVDENETLKRANSKLQIEKAELLDLIEDYKKTVRKYHNFSSHLLVKYKDLKSVQLSDQKSE